MLEVIIKIIKNLFIKKEPTTEIKHFADGFHEGRWEDDVTMESLHNMSIPVDTEIQEEKQEMSKFDEIIEGVLKHEGGYVNDPTDLGGETNFGITKRFYPDVDIKNLTKEGAKEIYKKDYWDKNKVDDLPDDLKHIFFDMCVNQGRGTAVRVLQRAINGKGGDIAVDGGFGPGTKGALAKYKPSLERVRCYRLKHYYDLVNKKPEQEKFLFGWYRRALEV